jgi:hypothetical protein
VVIDEWPHLFEFIPMPGLFAFFGTMCICFVTLAMVRGADKGDE